MEIKEIKCPDCNKTLCDVRDRDDRIDFWCLKCKKKFQYKELVKDEN
jgi:phage FluMu protein Com